jgi:uncharacterized protein YegP (UPF0339 family)
MYFEIYQSSKDLKYYWRLVRRRVGAYNYSTASNEIIATGHQGYDTRDDAVKDIELVKRVVPSTRII